MKYDFTSLLNRSGHDAIAVDQIPIPGAEVKEGFSRIPMWVADMNFPSLPTIQEAIHARVNEPHFGYFNLLFVLQLFYQFHTRFLGTVFWSGFFARCWRNKRIGFDSWNQDFRHKYTRSDFSGTNYDFSS